MGAGYKTTRGTFVDDKMFEMPWQLMQNVMMKKDQQVDTMLEQADALGGLININSLEADNPQARELTKHYESEVDSLTNSILENPLEYQRQIGNIRGLGRKIQEDMEYGKWAALEDRYNSYIQSSKSLADLGEEDGITDEYKKRKLAAELEKAGTLTYDPKTGEYNRYSAEDITSMPDMNEVVKNALQGTISDSAEVLQDKVNGGWIIKEGEKEEHVSEERLAKIANDYIQGDSNLLSAVKQRSRFGVSGFENVVDENGNVMSPAYVEMAEGLDQNGQPLKDSNGNIVEVPQLRFQDNFLGRSVRAGVEKYGFSKTSRTREMRDNPFAVLNYKEKLHFSRKKKEEEMDREYTRLGVQDTVTSVAGANRDEYKQNKEAATQGITGTRQEALEKYKEFMRTNSGVDFSKENVPSEVEKSILEDGDFSVLADAGVSEYDINKLQNEHNSFMMRQNTIQGYEDTWKADMRAEWEDKKKAGESVPDFNTYLEENEGKFDTFLSSSYENTLDRQATWDGLDISEKAVTNIQNDFEKNLSVLKINSPLFNGRTLNEAIADGTVKVKREKVPVIEGLTPEQKEVVAEYNRLATSDDLSYSDRQDLKAYSDLPFIKNSGKVSYQIQNSSGEYVNFEIEKESLKPMQSLSDDGELDMVFVMKVDGESTLARVGTDEFTTSSIEEVKNANTTDLKIKLYLEKNAKANNIKGINGAKIDIRGNTITVDGKPPIRIREGETGRLTAGARAILSQVVY